MWPPRYPNWFLNGRKPQFFLGRTEVSPRSLWAGRLPWGLQIHLWCSKNSSNPRLGSVLAPLGPSYEDKVHSRPICTHSSTQMRPSKQLLVLKKTHVFIGSVLTRSSVVTQCRTACNVELLAMSNYLQCLLDRGAATAMFT